MIPEADYNSMEGENISLDTDDVLVYSTGENWGEDQLQMGNQNVSGGRRA